MANLIETQRVYKILKRIIKDLDGKAAYTDSWYQVFSHGDSYTIISVRDQSKFMSIRHSERSVSWSVPKDVSVLSIQKVVL